ncbi:hypothetical protein [Streptomyces heilongjiangensis]|uniref:Uncharacterized protein n=1 Tax=Streptomyces heilongjiangensis TaxID=945052 RepID=A0ABW1BJB1_9ACTN|nr:hypothetical protein [Streptomyces heilongjiangensis]MDC2952443.1 hypothetical protein [Streptomyces heilongjiangensis]
MTGPAALVMSQVNTCEGAVATSSGSVFAGWVAWRRRSPDCPFSRRIRYIVETEQW